jgi:hypothetical protein
MWYNFGGNKQQTSLKIREFWRNILAIITTLVMDHMKS